MNFNRIPQRTPKGTAYQQQIPNIQIRKTPQNKLKKVISEINLRKNEDHSHDKTHIKNLPTQQRRQLKNNLAMLNVFQAIEIQRLNRIIFQITKKPNKQAQKQIKYQTIELLTQKCKKYEEQEQFHKAAYQKLKNMYVKSIKQNEQIELKIAVLKKNQSVFQKKLDQQKQANKRLSSKISEINEKLTNNQKDRQTQILLMTDLSNRQKQYLNQKIQELEKANKKLIFQFQSQIKQKQFQIKKLEILKNQCENKNEKINKQFNRLLSNKDQQIQQNYHKNQTQLRQIKHQNQILKQQIDQHKQHFNNLQTKNRIQIDKNTELQSQSSRINYKLQQRQYQIKQLTQINHQINQKIAKFNYSQNLLNQNQTQLTAYKQQNQRIRQEKYHLDRQLSLLKTNQYQIKQQISNLKELLMQKNEQNKEIQTINNELLKKIKNYDKAIQKSMAKLEESYFINANIHGLEKANQNLQTTNEELQKTIKQSTFQNARLKQENVKLKSENEQLNSEKDELKQILNNFKKLQNQHKQEIERIEYQIQCILIKINQLKSKFSSLIARDTKLQEQLSKNLKAINHNFHQMSIRISKSNIGKSQDNFNLKNIIAQNDDDYQVQISQKIKKSGSIVKGEHFLQPITEPFYNPERSPKKSQTYKSHYFGKLQIPKSQTIIDSWKSSNISSFKYQ